MHTYAAWMYEMQFLMGALAGLLSEKHRIGYVAEVLVYEEVVRINAFS